MAGGAWIESRRGHAVVNYGATSGHLPARIKLMHGVDAGQHRACRPRPAKLMRDIRSNARLQPSAPPPDARSTQLAALLEQGLDEGALGIGMGITYTPGATQAEILRLFETAAERGVPVFVHLRAS